jgi:hypothetical protein
MARRCTFEANWVVLVPTVALSLDPNDFPTLKTGEATTNAHIEKWASRMTLFNTYGSGEYTVLFNSRSRKYRRLNNCFA